MNPRVLFAEDDPSIRESFSAILKLEGVTVTSCASADEACQKLADGLYDLVITDMRMETPTAGWKVVRAARSLQHPPDVALMTAFPIPKSDLRHHRIDGIVSKGMPTAALVSRLRELIQKSVAHRAGRPPEKEPRHNNAF